MIDQIDASRSRWPAGSGGRTSAGRLMAPVSASRFGLPGCGRRGHTGLMRVVVTRIEWDGTMRRRLVDTAGRKDASQGERLVPRALAIRPLYRPVPEGPLYHVQVNEWAVLVAEDDLSGPLSDLVTAVLAMGESRLWPGAGTAVTGADG